MRALISGLFLLVALNAVATPTNLTKSNPVRKQVLDAVRPQFANFLHQKVVLDVKTARIEGDYAFIQARPLQPNGKQIDFSHTQYKEALAHGAFDSSGDALLKKTGGHWKVLAFEFGHTDVGYMDWPTRFGCSYPLLGMPKP